MQHPPKRPSAARPGSTVPPAALCAMQSALAAHKAGQHADAIRGYRQALKHAPGLPEAHYNLGILLKAAGQSRAAERALGDAVRLRPSYQRAHVALADLFDRSGNAAKALRHWLDAFRLAPDDPGVLSGLVARLGSMRFSQADPRLAEIVAELLRRVDVEGQRLAPAALSLLALDERIATALRTSDPGALSQTDPPPLLLALLERASRWLQASRRPTCRRHGAISSRHT